jgi:hypothetical protein
MNMKAKMPCILALDLMGSQAAMAMAAATFNSNLAPFFTFFSLAPFVIHD